MSDTRTLLSNLGLDEKEISIYTALLDVSGMTILELSKKTSIPRSSLYRIVGDLEQKGFIEVEEEETDIVRAVGPSEMEHLVIQKEMEFENFKKSMKELAKTKVTKGQNIGIAYYKGEEDNQRLLHNTLGLEGVIRIILPVTEENHFSKSFISKLGKSKVTVKLLLVGSDSVEKDNELNRTSRIEVRYHSIPLDGFTYIYGNTVALPDNKGTTAIEVKNEGIADNYKKIFDSMWDDAISETKTDTFVQEPLANLMN